MGDVGALAIGAALGAVAVMLRQEIVLILMAGVMMMETLSVVLQVISYRLTGRRIFAMAPLHHHFELARLAGTPYRGPFLDHHGGSGVAGAGHPESSVTKEGSHGFDHYPRQR